MSMNEKMFEQMHVGRISSLVTRCFGDLCLNPSVKAIRFITTNMTGSAMIVDTPPACLSGKEISQPRECHKLLIWQQRDSAFPNHACMDMRGFNRALIDIPDQKYRRRQCCITLSKQNRELAAIINKEFG